MGFSIKWCKWIMECLRSTTTSVFVNRSSTDEFHLGRGLRQDDPLSLFLFLIAAEGFNIMLNATIHAGEIEGRWFENGMGRCLRIVKALPFGTIIDWMKDLYE
uniref:RNA-directed DNA polymerase, putative n=1 Tax=Medicago truncatula TaxID=3880 RepID=A2Q1C6_MEDTR|nr:RNA-directed DNA polymerase, putative [Medicago truncatula]